MLKASLLKQQTSSYSACWICGINNTHWHNWYM